MQPQSNMVERTCEHCGATFLATRYQIRIGHGTYCSRSCTARSAAGEPEDRFWSCVDKHGPVPEHRPELGPCWVWTGSRRGIGYGRLSVHNTMRMAHRYSWELNVGPIPDGLWVLHKCDNRVCVNPSHLFLGTSQDNVADRDAKGRTASGTRNGAATRPDRIPRGEMNPRAVLRESDVLSIRARYASGGVSLQEIANEYGISKQSIWRAIRGKAWRHL